MNLFDILNERAEQAVVEHTRLVLIGVLILLQHAETKEQAIHQIQEFLQSYGNSKR